MKQWMVAFLATLTAGAQSIPMPGPGMYAQASNGYAHHLIFTFNVHPNSNLIAFPNLISGTYAGMADTGHGGYVTHTTTLNGQTVPADLIFTSDSAGSTLLSWEIESWSNTTGAIVAWVKADRSSSADTPIYAWVGKASVTTYQCTASATWDDNTVAVWHMMENAASTTVHDSTANANAAVAADNTSAFAAAGHVNGGFSSLGGDYYNTRFSLAQGSQTGFPASQGDFTWSAWVYRDRSSFGSVFGLWGWGVASTQNQFLVNVGGSDYQVTYSFYGAADDTGYVLPDKTWVHLAGTYHAGVATLYVNGSLAYTSGTTVVSILPSSFTVGTTANGQWYYGSLDEFEFSGCIRSADWIAHEYRQQSQASAWYTVGSWL